MSGDERDERGPGPGTRDAGGVAEDVARPVPAYAPPGPEPRGPGPEAPSPDEPGPTSWRAVAALLRDEPNGVHFFQAVRLLERMASDRAPVGGFGDPRSEVVRFTVPPSLAFPASEIQSLELEEAGPARMSVNFLGLTGPVGVLPHAYTQQVAERARARDTALRDFLDIFHHRLISLFYRAWEKHHFGVRHERERHDPLAEHVADLVGLGTPGLRQRLGVRDESLLFYSGLLASHRTSALALEQLLADYFGVPAVVEQFVGGWYALEEGDLCALDDDALLASPSSTLGLGAVVGDEIWDQQARVRVRLGPLTRAQYDDFLPGSAGLVRLGELVRVFARDEIDFEVQLVLAREAVPACRLGGEEGDVLPLGYTTWLATRPLAADPGDTVLQL